MLEKMRDRDTNRENIDDECHCVLIEDKKEEDYRSINSVFHSLLFSCLISDVESFHIHHYSFHSQQQNIR